MFWVLISDLKSWGLWCGVQTLLHRKQLWVLSSFPSVGPCAWGVVFMTRLCLSLSSFLVWCVILAQLVFYRGYSSICSCRFGVFMAGGEFRISLFFLCCHLEPELSIPGYGWTSLLTMHKLMDIWFVSSFWNKVVRNICVQVFAWTYVFIFLN